MKILAIDTATEACSVALTVGDELLERHQLAPREHASLVLPWVEELLAESGYRLPQLDAIAFGCGPGSFTSLRIGLGVVQGLALGAGLEVLPVSSLRALAQAAYEASGEEHIAAMTDARMQQVYCGFFKVGKTGLVHGYAEEAVLSPAAVKPPAEHSWVGAGNGFDQYRAELEQAMGNRLAGIIADQWPRASCLIRLAVEDLQTKPLLPPEQALPNYVRNKVADKPAS